jgi:hypothetical protein
MLPRSAAASCTDSTGAIALVALAVLGLSGVPFHAQRQRVRLSWCRESIDFRTVTLRMEGRVSCPLVGNSMPSREPTAAQTQRLGRGSGMWRCRSPAAAAMPRKGRPGAVGPGNFRSPAPDAVCTDQRRAWHTGREHRAQPPPLPGLAAPRPGDRPPAEHPGSRRRPGPCTVVNTNPRWPSHYCRCTRTFIRKGSPRGTAKELAIMRRSSASNPPPPRSTYSADRKLGSVMPLPTQHDWSSTWAKRTSPIWAGR